MAYISSLDRKRDYNNTLAYAKKVAKKEGEEKKSYEVVENLLAAGRFTIAEIADYASVTVGFVEQVRDSFSNKK